MKTHPSRRTHHALTLVEVVVIVAAIAILAVFVLVPLYRAKAYSTGINCINNLKSVGLAFRIWAGDKEDRFPMEVSTNVAGTAEWVVSGLAWPHLRALSNELNTPKSILCPDDKQRTAATEWNELVNSNISYFVGVDASSNRPAMLLSGDRQMTRERKELAAGLYPLDASQTLGWSKRIHRHAGPGIRGKRGHVMVVDGSVERVDATGFRLLLENSGAPTNRLAIP